ncbi:MAG: class I SAM-dependent methyltransferase [Coriobacteriales bacterium]|nr:class I SAM-dependent methyltransferase [Coriobacteriales bacterium]
MDLSSQAATASSEPAVDLSLEFIDRLFGPVPKRDFGFVLWDGTVWGSPSAVEIRLCHPGALRAMFLPPGECTLGEAYIRGDFEISGDAESAVDLVRGLAEAKRSPSEYARLGLLLLRLPESNRDSDSDRPRLRGRQHSRERDRCAIRHHYDVGNDFYELWLDEEMAYSCAYFKDGSEDLGAAQRAKFEHICRKLNLQPGERLLDIGCGWGGLLRHAAREYGVEGVGITLSDEQASFARARAKEDLADRLTFELLDYRDAPQLGTFDKIVSVGMFEHVGQDNLPDYFRSAHAALEPGGLFLNHGIAAGERGFRIKRGGFIDRYVFPDGQLHRVSEALDAAESAGFEVRDVESLREHYAMTLRHWIERLERNAAEAQRRTSQETFRIWRLYMAGAAHGFRSGKMSVYQSLLAKPTGDVSGLPLTRDHIYDIREL